MFKKLCCKTKKDNKSRLIYPQTLIKLNRIELNENPNRKYASNCIKTTKYTIWTFLPLNLWEQFHRFANVYFVFILILNFMPGVNAFAKEVAPIPVVLTLATIAIKDAYEDFRRHLSDRRVNRKLCNVYSIEQKCYVEKQWQQVRVGDFIRLITNDTIPADVLLLASSNSSGICHIETSNLDGESNLKQREVVNGYSNRQDEFSPQNFTYPVEVEAPNPELYKFHGKIIQGDVMIPIQKKNVLLRGCTLRNTDFVEGLVLYAGRETKAALNNTGVRFKRSKLERRINMDVIWCVCILAIVCFTGAIGSAVWHQNLPGDNVLFVALDRNSSTATPAFQGFLNFWRFVIIFQSIIPLPLYVTIEFVKMHQVWHMNNDLGLYDPVADKRIEVRAFNIPEDLGQIEYVFCDKTGTLTENKMEFKRASINGVDYCVTKDINEEIYPSGDCKSHFEHQLSNPLTPKNLRNLDSVQPILNQLLVNPNYKFNKLSKNRVKSNLSRQNSMDSHRRIISDIRLKQIVPKNDQHLNSFNQYSADDLITSSRSIKISPLVLHETDENSTQTESCLTKNNTKHNSHDIEKHYPSIHNLHNFNQLNQNSNFNLQKLQQCEKTNLNSASYNFKNPNNNNDDGDDDDDDDDPDDDPDDVEEEEDLEENDNESKDFKFVQSNQSNSNNQCIQQFFLALTICNTAVVSVTKNTPTPFQIPSRRKGLRNLFRSSDNNTNDRVPIKRMKKLRKLKQSPNEQKENCVKQTMSLSSLFGRKHHKLDKHVGDVGDNNNNTQISDQLDEENEINVSEETIVMENSRTDELESSSKSRVKNYRLANLVQRICVIGADSKSPSEDIQTMKDQTNISNRSLPPVIEALDLNLSTPNILMDRQQIKNLKNDIMTGNMRRTVDILNLPPSSGRSVADNQIYFESCDDLSDSNSDRFRSDQLCPNIVMHSSSHSQQQIQSKSNNKQLKQQQILSIDSEFGLIRPISSSSTQITTIESGFQIDNKPILNSATDSFTFNQSNAITTPRILTIVTNDGSSFELPIESDYVFEQNELKSCPISDNTLFASYESESPDELCLVKLACKYGYKLLQRGVDFMLLWLPKDGLICLHVIRILPFDSVRKRMSILFRHPITNEAVLFTKGADSAILNRLDNSDSSQDSMIEATYNHIEQYSRIGLRTLVIAKRVIPEVELNEWLEEVYQVETGVTDPTDEMQNLMDKLERNFTLLGVTGIEDRLQEGVPETIQSLREAGMHVWVLTGDKQETAINIAHLANLITPDHKLMYINANSEIRTGYLINSYLYGILSGKFWDPLDEWDDLPNEEINNSNSLNGAIMRGRSLSLTTSYTTTTTTTTTTTITTSSSGNFNNDNNNNRTNTSINTTNNNNNNRNIKQVRTSRKTKLDRALSHSPERDRSKHHVRIRTAHSSLPRDLTYAPRTYSYNNNNNDISKSNNYLKQKNCQPVCQKKIIHIKRLFNLYKKFTHASTSSSSNHHHFHRRHHVWNSLPSQNYQQFALIIDGETLNYVLNGKNKTRFLKLTQMCTSVICCRSTPAQKAAVVNLIKTELKAHTLAIGDGANDVNMIQVANVGIGISGEEGMQAVMASDFAITRFHYLKRLLLVHGHWCYDKLAQTSLYLFYKDTIFVLVLFWFQMFNGFSGSNAIDQLSQILFSITFTGLPPFIMGIWDNPLDQDTLLANPILYRNGIEGKAYRPWLFWLNIFDAAWQSLIIFFMAYLAHADDQMTLWMFGLFEIHALILCSLIHAALETRTWVIIHGISFFMSYFVAFLTFTLIYHAVAVTAIPPESPHWVIYKSMSDPNFWFLTVITVVLALLPRMLIITIKNTFHPSMDTIANMLAKRLGRGKRLPLETYLLRVPYSYMIGRRFSTLKVERRLSCPSEGGFEPYEIQIPTFNTQASVSSSCTTSVRPSVISEIPGAEAPVHFISHLAQIFSLSGRLIRGAPPAHVTDNLPPAGPTSMINLDTGIHLIQDYRSRRHYTHSGSALFERRTLTRPSSAANFDDDDESGLPPVPTFWPAVDPNSRVNRRYNACSSTMSNSNSAYNNQLYHYTNSHLYSTFPSSRSGRQRPPLPTPQNSHITPPDYEQSTNPPPTYESTENSKHNFYN